MQRHMRKQHSETEDQEIFRMLETPEPQKQLAPGSEESLPASRAPGGRAPQNAPGAPGGRAPQSAPGAPEPLRMHNSLVEPPTSSAFNFQHPFTGMVAGPTSCGKSFLVKDMLQRYVISPPPERIIWLYKRWQPLYDVIKAMVKPDVEFIQGIPLDLEKDTFLDTQVRNLIILDDLMSTAAKDPRITDLFTEGSHHRNLSVLAITQNLYFSKDPTQRRNCHYMVLFKNPIDQQQVMTLARQSTPGILNTS